MTVERKKTVGIWSARRFNRPRLAQTRLSEIRSASLLVARYTRAPIFPFHRNGFWRKSSSRASPLPLRGFSLSACQLCQRRLQPQPPSCSRPHKAVLCLPRRRWKRCRAVFFFRASPHKLHRERFQHQSCGAGFRPSARSKPKGLLNTRLRARSNAQEISLPSCLRSCLSEE